MSDLMIISGGQTGVDRGALDAALELGFPCSGKCPAKRLAEDGRIPDHYPLTEIGQGYRQRTIQNILDSDGTLIIYYVTLSGGTEQTLVHCINKERPYQLIDGALVGPTIAAKACQEFIANQDISVLNVAGPRKSKWAKGDEFTRETITRMLQDLSGH